jgi:hypothetical protein
MQLNERVAGTGMVALPPIAWKRLGHQGDEQSPDVVTYLGSWEAAELPVLGFELTKREGGNYELTRVSNFQPSYFPSKGWGWTLEGVAAAGVDLGVVIPEPTAAVLKARLNEAMRAQEQQASANPGT